jgi:chorismate mutase
VALLARRYAVVGRVAGVKASADTPMMQPDRVVQVRRHWSAVAREHGCDPEDVLAILEALFARTFAYEDERIAALRHGDA